MRISDWSSDVCSSDLFTTDPKILGTMDLSVEDVIALEPDLILWTRSDNTQATYDKLSAIAPTVGPPPGLATAYGTTVEQQTELVAKALGKESEGQALLDGLDARSDEHTSELQSLMRNSFAVFCLKKKNTHTKHT